MSKNKGGRPDVWNADYFPHAVKMSNELRYLEHTYGAEGYRAYWRILEQLAFTEYHYVKLETEYDWTTFRINCNVEKDILDNVIKYLLDRGILDEELYKENKLWSPYLIGLLKPLYVNRRKPPPQKVGTDIVTTCKNPQYSKVKKVKNSKHSSTTTTNDLKNKYPDIDVDKSLKKLFAKNPNADDGDITRWLDSDVINGMNIKLPDFKQYETGLYKVYCAKCNAKEFANTIKDARYGESCCGVEWLPEPANG